MVSLFFVSLVFDQCIAVVFVNAHWVNVSRTGKLKYLSGDGALVMLFSHKCSGKDYA
jgi:hypothetical protein